ncbi:MAG: two-component sensor histidine kinase [Alphaproteobacteria bacterium 64-6]|nr:MAG: two-component sensor histidine kinase [Alphaproteobacteria bacterium 64-6]
MAATIVDPAASPRRPRIVRPHRGFEVREARRRLALDGEGKPQFEHEMTLMFVRNELSAVATIQLLAVIFSLASMFWATKTEAILWLVLVIGAKVALLELCRRFVALPRNEINIKVWRRRLILAETVNGVVWAGFALVGMGATDSASHVFLFASLIVVLAIRMTFASTALPILYVGTIPMTMAVVVRLLMLGHPFYWAMASMALGVHVYFIFLAKGLNSTALAMLEYRAEKDALIAELEQEKATSDEARRRAEGANIAKSRFLATMSHELRTPLNAILGFSEVMKAELLGPLKNATYKEYAANVHYSGSHLLHLINEILDISRIEAGKYDLNEESIRLVDVAEDCHRLLKLRAESKNLTIELDLDHTLPMVWADERAMRQVCLNLLSNALKFTPKGGRITVNVCRDPSGGQTISIRDTGPGIPREEIPRIMQAFGQGSLAHENAEGGTGLGLPIVKSLVELHEGVFELRSEVRKGTEVLVTIPRQRVMEALPPLQPLGQERHRSNTGYGEWDRPARLGGRAPHASMMG